MNKTLIFNKHQLNLALLKLMEIYTINSYGAYIIPREIEAIKDSINKEDVVILKAGEAYDPNFEMKSYEEKEVLDINSNYRYSDYALAIYKDNHVQNVAESTNDAPGSINFMQYHQKKNPDISEHSIFNLKQGELKDYLVNNKLLIILKEENIAGMVNKKPIDKISFYSDNFVDQIICHEDYNFLKVFVGFLFENITLEESEILTQRDYEELIKKFMVRTEDAYKSR